MNRRYPAHPIAGVGAVVLTADGDVVLVKRRLPPLAGRWSLPGGAVELGETLADAIVREVREETGLVSRTGPVIHALDRIHRDAAGRVEYHYVLVDFLSVVERGVLAAATDAADVAAVPPSALTDFDLPSETLDVIRRAIVVSKTAQF